MKKTNKLLALFLSILMICSVVAGVSVSADTYVTGDLFKIRLESNTEAMIAEYYGNDTTMIIPETVLEKKITGIIPSAFEGNSFIKHVVLPSTLTTIGAYAFAESTALEDFTITSSINKLVMFAFSKATALEKVVFEEGLLTTIPRNCFYKCTALTDVQISSNITTIEQYAFTGCTALETIYIPSTVTSIAANAFSSNPQLTIICDEGSYAEQYCINNGLSYQFKPEPVDKTELKSVLFITEDILANLDYYRPLTVANLQSVYNNALAVYNNDSATEEDVANAVQLLNAEIVKAKYYDLGDVDLNEAIDIKDATRVQMYVAKYAQLTAPQMYFADVDGDGLVKITDATKIQMIVTKFV